MTNEVPAHPNAAPQGPPGVPQQYPPQGYPPQGHPPQGYPPQGYPPQGYPPQGYPPQGAPPGAYPPQGYPPQGYPPQGAPPNGQIQQIIPPEHRGVTGAPIIVQPAIPSNTNYNVLTTVPKLYIKQKIDILEALTGFEQKNRYGVHLSKEDQDAGRKWLHAKEDSSCFCRLFFNPRHELKLKVEFPNDGPKILEGHRPCAWCLNHMEVKDPHTKNEIGTIDQNCTDLIGWCPTKTTLNDAQGHEMYTIEGPPPVLLQLCMMWPCRNPFDFKITKDGQPTGGVVQNVPNGCLKMCFTSADDYVITFPENANAEERAMILMYTFLLDYMFFQGKQQNRNNNNNTLML